ncbi:MAG: hypothetical protein QE278_14815 [Limnobacter sp.]|nr:hypothetical protein [Limnobacter sp.]
MASNISITHSAIAATIPTFILLNLTGMTAFHGFEATLLVTALVGSTVVLAQGAQKISDMIYHSLVSV